MKKGLWTVLIILVVVIGGIILYNLFKKKVKEEITEGVKEGVLGLKDVAKSVISDMGAALGLGAAAKGVSVGGAGAGAVAAGAGMGAAAAAGAEAGKIITIGKAGGAVFLPAAASGTVAPVGAGAAGLIAGAPLAVWIGGFAAIAALGFLGVKQFFKKEKPDPAVVKALLAKQAAWRAKYGIPENWAAKSSDKK